MKCLDFLHLTFDVHISHLFCRSRSVISVSASMEFHPSEIALSSYECSVKDRNVQAASVSVCFTQAVRSAGYTGDDPPHPAEFSAYRPHNIKNGGSMLHGRQWKVL